MSRTADVMTKDDRIARYARRNANKRFRGKKDKLPMVGSRYTPLTAEEAQEMRERLTR